jgi:hypothetical protein
VVICFACDGLHTILLGMRLWRFATCSISLGVPDSNRVVTRTRDYVSPIGRVPIQHKHKSEPTEQLWLPLCNTLRLLRSPLACPMSRVRVPAYPGLSLPRAGFVVMSARRQPLVVPSTTHRPSAPPRSPTASCITRDVRRLRKEPAPFLVPTARK